VEQCREMVLEARKLEALEDTPRDVQTQKEIPAPAPEPRTPSTFIEKVLNEESMVHIETMGTEHMDTTLPEEGIPRLTPDLDNNNPEEGPQGKSDLMAENGNPWLRTPDGDDLIIAYIRGEPVISIFEPEQTPLAEEYFEPQIGYFQSEKHATVMGRVSGSGQRHPYSKHWNMQAARTSRRPRNLLITSSQAHARNTDDYLKKQHLNDSPSPGLGIT